MKLFIMFLPLSIIWEFDFCIKLTERKAFLQKTIWFINVIYVLVVLCCACCQHNLEYRHHRFACFCLLPDWGKKRKGERGSRGETEAWVIGQPGMDLGLKCCQYDRCSEIKFIITETDSGAGGALLKCWRKGGFGQGIVIQIHQMMIPTMGKEVEWRLSVSNTETVVDYHI